MTEHRNTDDRADAALSAAAGRQTSCPFCGHAGHDRLRPAGQTRWSYLRCANCQAGRIDPMPTDLPAFYDRGYFVGGGERAGYADYEADEPWHRRTARQRLARVELARRRAADSNTTRAADPNDTRAVGSDSRPGRLVDVGTATGFLLDEARRQGWQASGVELSAWAADKARGRGFEVVDRLDEVDRGEGVDAITFFQSLEHLPDPVAALRQAAALLAPGGVLVCETWDVQSWTARLAGPRWQQLSPPSVLWLFSRQALAEVLAEQGLVITRWRTSPKLVSLGTVLGQSLPSGGGRGPGAALVRALGPRVGLPYALDDLVTFTATRADRARTEPPQGGLTVR